MKQKFPFASSHGFSGAIGFLLLAIAVAPAGAQTVNVGQSPYSIALNPVTNKIYVGATPCTVIDGTTNVATNIPGTATYFPMVVNSVSNKIYFLNNLTLGLGVIDGATNAVTNISLGGASIQQYAVNPVTNKVYVTVTGNPGATIVIDGATNAILANLPMGDSPANIAVNTVTNKIYVVSSNLVTVIDGATNALTNIPISALISPIGLAVNTATNQVFLATIPFVVINGATNAVTKYPLTVGGLSAFAYDPVTNVVYLGITGGVMAINGFTGAASPAIPTGINPAFYPDFIAVNPVTNTIMVANSDTTLTVINGTTNATTTMPFPGGAFAIAVNPTTNQFYALNGSSNTVTDFAGPAGTLVTVPAFITLPQNQSASAGQAVTFTGSASGSPIYQWLFNGTAIAGTNNASLTVNNVTAASVGTYTLVATNSGGFVSASATLTVAANSPPAFTTQPVPQTVVSGTTVVFNSAASGSPAPSFQWKLNSANVTNATSARLVISGATAANAGTYTCVATNSQGSATSNPAALAFTSSTNVGRLVNLSVNTTAGKSQVLTVGFVSGGAGTSGSENLLIRATGPALAALGVGGTLADPTLTVFNGSTVIASNDNWGTPASNQSAVTAADTATFAFPLTNPASLDAALATALSFGAYTAQIGGNTAASGTALAEVYDNTPTASYTLATPRLINLSAKNQIAAGGAMTAGFVVGGTTSKTVLIRATGPALAGLGVPGTIPDPQIALHTSINGQDTVLATNAGWGGDPQIAAVSNSVFAFPLTNPASADSVVLVTLAPGAYTAVSSSVSGAAGTVLIEVYEVP